MALGLVEEEQAKPNAISLTFDAGEFYVQGKNSKTYTIPIAGAFRINNRVAYRWRGITATHGNYISFFEGDVLGENDPKELG
jgi:hypothetical protein